jgi:hypothetical protein
LGAEIRALVADMIVNFEAGAFNRSTTRRFAWRHTAGGI